MVPTTVRVVLDATVTGSSCESHVLQQRLNFLPPLLKWLLLDAGYDDQTLLVACHQRGIKTLVPLSKPIGASKPLSGGNALTNWPPKPVAPVINGVDRVLNPSLPP